MQPTAASGDQTEVNLEGTVMVRSGSYPSNTVTYLVYSLASSCCIQLDKTSDAVASHCSNEVKSSCGSTERCATSG